MYFATIALLRAQTLIPTNTEFIVGGHSLAGDGGGGTFIWVTTAPPPTLPDDDGIIIHPPSAINGYFMRLFSGPINVRWFGAKGNGVTDDTAAVHAARDSAAFANNGTLYFPVGIYRGAFIFDRRSGPIGLLNEINIKGDGHGSVLRSNGTEYSPGDHKPVVIAGWRFPAQEYARISDITIDGQSESAVKYSDGVRLANPSTVDEDELSGYWAFERVLFINCRHGVDKPFGNIGNHYLNCTWRENVVGVSGRSFGAPGRGMHNGCDRYTGGHLAKHDVAGLEYTGGTLQIIIDGTIIESNNDPTKSPWGIKISSSGRDRMLYDAVCIRNVYFETNGNNLDGGDMYFEGLRSVRIDDCRLHDRIRLVESSVNLYNCLLTRDAGNTDVQVDVDKKSSLIAYEHRYSSFPTSRVFVNSISYDGSHDIQEELHQSTSVWGPLRSVISTRSHFLVSEQFDTSSEPFSYLSGGTGIQNTSINPNQVLGKASGRLSINAGGHMISDNVIGNIGPDPIPKYIVWSIHTFLQDPLPQTGSDLEQIYGEIKTDGVNLGHVYFKYDQWACSYGMKLIDVSSKLDFRLHFNSSFAAIFCITDYQILAFDDLSSANAYVNSREFCVPPYYG